MFRQRVEVIVSPLKGERSNRRPVRRVAAPAQPSDASPEKIQPRLARAATKVLRKVSVGVVAGIAQVVCMLVLSARMLRDTRDAEIWALIGNVCSVLLALVTFMQAFLWSGARREWRGRRAAALRHWMLPTHFGKWVSYLFGIAVPVSALRMAYASHGEGGVWWLAAGAVVGSVIAVAFAARRSFDPEGPRGIKQHSTVDGERAGA